MNIETRREKERGCGYRKGGGLYLVSGEMGVYCGKLPFELKSCPCCGEGIKPSRGFTWIQAKLIEDAECNSGDQCRCSMSQEPWNLNPEEKLGLMWVGGNFYKTTHDFVSEAMRMGISKRIAQIPKDLVVGQTWVLLAHREAVVSIQLGGNAVKKPGVFQAFRPTAIEYVVKGDESEKELKRLEKRGIKLVRVIPDKQEEGSLFKPKSE